MENEIMMWSHVSTVSPVSDAHAGLLGVACLKVSRSFNFASSFVVSETG